MSDFKRSQTFEISFPKTDFNDWCFKVEIIALWSLFIYADWSDLLKAWETEIVSKFYRCAAIIKTYLHLLRVLSFFCRNMIVFKIFITFVLMFLFKYCWKRRNWYRASWNLPGIISFPFIGGAYIFRNTSGIRLKKCY